MQFAIMNIVFSLITLASVALVHAQQGEKGNLISPYPRAGRPDRFFLADKRNGNFMTPGSIPLTRNGLTAKRPLIPFPGLGKRPVWHMEPSYFAEYEDFSPMIDPNFLVGATFPGMEVPANMQQEGDVEKRSQTPNASGGMWFGPRLGKRKKRSIDTTSAAESSSEHRDTLDTKTLLKILHNFNWAIVPVKERRNFTPRLGRSSQESLVVHQRAQPFSPRLGRSKEVAQTSSNELEIDDDMQARNHYQRRNEDRGHDDTGGTQDPPADTPYIFSPRLGRADPFSPRLGRADPFSPRLGRADPFSPRLGRSGSNDDRE